MVLAPAPRLSQKFEPALRTALPLLSVLAAIILDALPWPWMSPVSPGVGLTLMTIYYWTLHRPDLFTPATLFVLGLVTDAAAGLPLGLNGMIWLGLYLAILKGRHMIADHPFLMLWAGFALAISGSAMCGWIILSLLQLTWIAPGMVVTHILLGVALFPLVALALIRLHRLIPSL